MNVFQLSAGSTRVTFDEVRAVGTRYEVIDGKKRRRQKTFYQTVNPFNKNADGSVKTRAEVYAAVKAEACAKLADGQADAIKIPRDENGNVDRHDEFTKQLVAMKVVARDIAAAIRARGEEKGQ